MSKTSEMKCASYIYIYILTATILTSLSFVSFLFLASSSTSASDHVSNVSVTVPVSCNISSTLDTAHTATINPGQYKEDIGTTTFKVFCNDNTGYAIYAIGYSGDEYGNTNMLPTNPTTSTNPSIVTGTATSGDTSNWAMKVTPVAGTYAPTIENSFNSYRTIPDTYTKVASLNTNTDFTIGSSFQSTYRVFVSQTQPADTYTGKVKYTLVHPHTEPAPILPHETAELMEGYSFCSVLYFISESGNSAHCDFPGATIEEANTNIKAIKMSPSLPDNANYEIISSYDSYNPVYAWFDNTNNIGTIYIYSDARQINMNEDLRSMFSTMTGLTDISAVANWNTSSVTTMHSMFFDAPSLTNIDALKDWDTSSVTDMSYMFFGASSLTNIDALKDWDTSSVTNMSGVLAATSLTNIDALKDWDTSSVTNMSGALAATSLTNINGARNWNTGNVTNINYMFYRVNNIDATVLNNWNVSKITNKSYAFTCPADKRPSWY